MKRTRRKFSKAFKVKVVLECLKERETLSELAKRYELHANQISQWKREFIENAESAFEGDKSSQDSKQKEDQLYRKIGELEIENDFLKKSLWKTGL